MRLQKSIERLFAQWGEKGGKSRARHLTPFRRSLIASEAARARWQKGHLSSSPLSSIRLTQPDWTSPVYLEEVLSRGSVSDWKKLYERITDHPFGTTAAALKKVLASGKIYGVTPLWKGFLNKAQGGLS